LDLETEQAVYVNRRWGLHSANVWTEAVLRLLQIIQYYHQILYVRPAKEKVDCPVMNTANPATPSVVDYVAMNQLLYEGKSDIVKQMTEAALANGRSVDEVLDSGLIAGMNVVGEDFKHNRLYVPQVLVAARAMKAGLAVLKPLLTSSGSGRQLGTVIMGTVKGDLHDIGKNLVCMMAEGAGFKVVDIGVDQPAQNFINAAREHNAHIVGMSALLTTTMTYMKTVIDAFKTEGLNDVKMCVGGAPISQMFADEIGADGYAGDAATAVEMFKTYMKVGVAA
jgi:methylmalonyl-CoA mutase cobalamin-binding domain/chain